MKYNKGFGVIGIILIIVGILVVVAGVTYFKDGGPKVPPGKNAKEEQNQNNKIVTNFDECIEAGNPAMESYPRQCRHEDERFTEVIENDSKEQRVAEESILDLENIETPLFIKSVYKKDGKWWADVDYVTKVTPLEHMTKEISEDFCVIPGMTKSEMLTYAKNTVKNYVKQDNLLVLNCGYDWQGIWSSDGRTPAMFINSNPLIRSLPFADKIEREIKICGISSISLTTPEKIKTEVDNRRGLDYSFDPYIQTYNTKGHLEELVIIKNGEIKKFYGPDGCAG